MILAVVISSDRYFGQHFVSIIYRPSDRGQARRRLDVAGPCGTTASKEHQLTPRELLLTVYLKIKQTCKQTDLPN